MSATQITIGSRKAVAHKAVVDPDFTGKTVLVEDTWDYVAMWLKRKGKGNEQIYWEQAKYFYEATRRLPNISAPLTAYYFALNATKALLSAKKIAFSDQHGVTGRSGQGKTSLSKEFVDFKRGGILAELCRYVDETADNQTYTIKDIFYNLPCIHRAYNLTFTSQPELFIPVEEPRFVRKAGSSEAWFCCDITDRRYCNKNTIKKLPKKYERDEGSGDCFTVRRKDRFKWIHGAAHKRNNLRNLTNYHRKVRNNLYYIQGSTKLWYLKRDDGPNEIIQRSSLTLTYAAMHRLSELARYEPMRLVKHFECQHNWLLIEFINVSRDQFLDEISAEITGNDFMVPGRR